MSAFGVFHLFEEFIEAAQVDLGGDARLAEGLCGFESVGEGGFGEDGDHDEGFGG